MDGEKSTNYTQEIKIIEFRINKISYFGLFLYGKYIETRRRAN